MKLKTIVRESKSVVVRCGDWGAEEIKNEHNETFQDNGMVLYFYRSGGYKMYASYTVK